MQEYINLQPDSAELEVLGALEGKELAHVVSELDGKERWNEGSTDPFEDNRVAALSFWSVSMTFRWLGFPVQPLLLGSSLPEKFGPIYVRAGPIWHFICSFVS